MNLLLIILAVLSCLPFFVQNYTKNICYAKEGEITNMKLIEISTSSNVTRIKNRTLIDKSKNEFYDCYNYSPNVQNDKNMTMVFNFSSVEILDNQSLFLWVYIPEVLLEDLTVTLGFGDSKLTWKLAGVSEKDVNYSNSLMSMLMKYSGAVKKGWKLLELKKSEAFKTGQVSNITTLSVLYSYSENLGESKDNSEFVVAYPFIADSFASTSSVVNHQGYVFYKKNGEFFTENSLIYVGDKLKINTPKELFSYVVVGNQNILDEGSGYSWNVAISSQVAANEEYSLDRKIEYEITQKGIYLIDINLKPSDPNQYVVTLLSETFNINAEEFRFGYFQKSNYKLIFTKLDETSSYGNLLNIKLYADADLSYVTTGQNVPDDIEVFDTQKIVKQLLGGR